MIPLQINETLVKQLIQEQFPQWQTLPIQEVKNGGCDNHTFHLGKAKLIRLPRDAAHAPPILKEYQWLPKLSKKLSLPITLPIALGEPSTAYPYYWSINRWIEGETVSKNTVQDMNRFATELGQFLKEFQSIDATGGPPAGPHNFYRGGALKAYDHEMQAIIPKIENRQKRQIASKLWQDALSSEWQGKPVWVHGDMATGNILVNEGKLCAIIDFGQLAIGDPACDLVITWNFFSGENREIFKNIIGLDQNTWLRALGWIFWKTLCWPVKGIDAQSILEEIYDDYCSMRR